MTLPANTVKVEGLDEVRNNYLNIITPSQNSDDADSSKLTTDIAVIEETGAGETGATYFIDEEGHYYQLVSDVQNTVITKSGTENEKEEQPNNFETTVYVFDEKEDSSEEENEEMALCLKSSRRRKEVKSQFTCTYCTYASPRRYLLLRHMKSHSDERPHKCRVCERGFKSTAALENHINTHNAVKPRVCKECNRRFTTSGELVRHVRYKHTHEKPHRCTECDYASVELSKLRRHTRSHTGERPYQCPHCTYASPDTFKLKRHLRTHTGEKPYKCDICEMSFTQSNSLKSHKLIHNFSARPVFACELCPATCSRKTDLRLHVQRLHTSGALNKCKTCGKCFPDRYTCRVHTKSHQGEKCFKCRICSYACAALRHLHSHMLNHTDEKPFTCNECDASFRQKQLLRRHQNVYHNPDYVPSPPKEKTYECHECKRRFAHKGNLLRHLAAVHDPNTDHRERARVLRLGRQKKIRYVDADPLNHTHEVSDEKQKEWRRDDPQKDEILTPSAADSERYVFLEIIHSDDSTEHADTGVDSEFYIEIANDDLKGDRFESKDATLRSRQNNTRGTREAGRPLNTKNQNMKAENNRINRIVL